MYDFSRKQLEQLLMEGQTARRYAWDHYEELAARSSTYKLYGPYTYGIGAGIPGGFIKPKLRKLSKHTSRKSYIMYELDGNFQLIRTATVFKNEPIQYTYHCFELDGSWYAFPFKGEVKQWYRSEITAIKYENGKPLYTGFLTEKSILVWFFEYISEDQVYVTRYAYSTADKNTKRGCLFDWDAPADSPNSPISRVCWKEAPLVTDFSQWFQ